MSGPANILTQAIRQMTEQTEHHVASESIFQPHAPSLLTWVC